MMPGMDGYELCRRIRGNSDYADIPIILVTVLSERKDRLRAVEVGANDYIAKPVELVELRLRVTSLLKMREAQERLKNYARDQAAAVEIRTADLATSEARCRQLYEEARSREELYHSVLAASPDAVVLYDVNGKAIFVSPSFTRMFGWTMEEIACGHTPYVPESERRPTRTVMDRLRKDLFVVSGFETKRLCKDGRMLNVSISASRFHDHRKNLAGMLFVIRDITKDKRTEKALRLREELFRSVFEAAQDSIFIKNRDLQYTHVNPAFLSTLELPAAAVLGKTDAQIFGSDFSKGMAAQELRALEGQALESEHTVTCRGVTKTFSFVRFPMRNSEGQTMGICAMARDVTERRRREETPVLAIARCESEAMKKTLEEIYLVAGSDSTVLFRGENGSGKDYLARHLHEISGRSSGSYLNLNCAAVPAELAESELFGHESGSFTGARGRRRGLFELADGGTVLLNEVGELPPNLQAKLLTFLDTHSFTRVGGEKNRFGQCKGARGNQQRS